LGLCGDLAPKISAGLLFWRANLWGSFDGP
jgi:hypothetical protein